MNLPKLDPNKPIHHSRPRAEADWRCPRYRYYAYEYDGVGLDAEVETSDMFLGTSLHDALAVIATFTKAGKVVDIDLIAATARKQVYDHLKESTAGLAEDIEEFAQEQSCLLEGLVRGFYKHQWHRILQRWPRILAIEADVTFRHNEKGEADPNGQFEFLAKPDLVVEGDEGPVYIEYKSTSSKRVEWINHWDKQVQIHATREAIKSSLGIDCTGVVVQGFYKGYECLSPETNILTADLRWIPVGMLKVGDRLGGFDEEPQKGRTGKPIRKWATANVQHVGRDWLPSYRLTFADGKSVVSSENHLWLTTKKGYGAGSAVWTKTKDLTTSHNLLRVLDVWHERDSYDAGYLAGAFDSEGCLVHHKDKLGYDNTWLTFTQNDNVVLQEVERILEKWGFGFKTRQHASRSTYDTMIGSRPDVLHLLGAVRPKRLLQKFSFDRLGGMRTLRLTQPTKIEFLGDQQVVTLGTSTETLIAEGLATHNSYGKLATPMVYAYHRWGNPPFTQTETLYEYKAGFKRYPVWQLDGGSKKWVDGMPEDVLMEQFPQTPVIFPDADYCRAFFTQRAMRELDIRFGREMLAKAKEANDPETARSILDVTFPQKFRECKQVRENGDCPMIHLCFGSVNDPLKAGMRQRTPHHSAEKESK